MPALPSKLGLFRMLYSCTAAMRPISAPRSSASTMIRRRSPMISSTTCLDPLSPSTRSDLTISLGVVAASGSSVHVMSSAKSLPKTVSTKSR